MTATAQALRPKRQAFEPTTRQRVQLRGLSKVRHYCAAGGSRSSKTFGFVYAIVLRAVKAPGSNHGIFRFRANAARASISLGTLPAVMRLGFPGVKIIEHRQDGFFELPQCGSSRIWVGGLDDDDRVEKILGNEFLTLFFNECSQIPYSSVLVALTRLAANDPVVAQRALYDLNPVGKGHWTNVLFGEKRDPRSRAALPDPENYDRVFMHPKDNPYLSKEYLDSLQNMPERQRKRFYEGLYVDEVDGALWSYETIEKCRVSPEDLPVMQRVVVAVDPSGAAGADGETNDLIGIVVAGLGRDGRVYILEDCSLLASPAKWGRAVTNAYHKWQADTVVAEVNYGGDMVSFVVTTADRNVPIKKITASRGKVVRAEPVSSLYEKGVVRHVGRFPELEDQMAAWSTSGYTGEGSPDRTDAMVWSVTELALQVGGHLGLLEHYRKAYEAQQGLAPDTVGAELAAGRAQPPTVHLAPGPGGVRVEDLGSRPAHLSMLGGGHTIKTHPAAALMTSLKE